MSLFKILHGDEERVSLDITPFHEGWCYITNNGRFFADINVGTKEEPIYERVETTSRSAYQIACAHGFEGTEEEWLESLKGAPGDPYVLTDEDVNIIRGEVVETLRPSKEAIELRLNSVEGEVEEVTDRLGILESAVRNLSSLSISRVESISEMTSENIIYLLPSDDGTFYYEYLVYEGVPELIGNTQIDLSNYVTKDYLRDKVRYYCHNVTLKYRSVNSSIHSKGADGVCFVSFQILNNDPEPYTFVSNYGRTSKATMLPDNAWQFLRLYRAVQFSTLKDITLGDCVYCKPCSGTCVILNTSDGSEIGRAIADSVISTYRDTDDLEWQRVLILQGTYGTINLQSTSDARFYILCGHPTFGTIGTDADGNDIKAESSIWQTKQEFLDNEYNKTDGSGKSYADYFCNQRLYCHDNVEAIPLVQI